MINKLLYCALAVAVFLYFRELHTMAAKAGLAGGSGLSLKAGNQSDFPPFCPSPRE